MSGPSATILNSDNTTPLKRTTVSDAAYAATAGDYLIAYITLTAARTVTIDPLHGGGTIAAPKFYIVQDEAGTAGTNNITVVPASGTIGGSASKIINANYGNLRIYSNGTNLFLW